LEFEDECDWGWICKKEEEHPYEECDQECKLRKYEEHPDLYLYSRKLLNDEYYWTCMHLNLSSDVIQQSTMKTQYHMDDILFYNLQCYVPWCGNEDSISYG
jgi:hypothetical protein